MTTSILNEKPSADADTGPLSSTRLGLPGCDTEAWVVVDSMVDGMAMGGTRMTRDVTEVEVAGLARAMTVKLALAGLPIGGAKAGIRPHGQVTDRDRVLRAFGSSVAPLLHGGIYLGCDQGTTHADRDLFLAAAGYDVRNRAGAARLQVDWRELWHDLTDITGYGVGIATLTALTAAGREGPQRVVVQGFGTVGRAAAAFLAEHGHSVVAIADIEGTIEDPAGLPIPALLAATDAAGTVDRSGLPGSVRCSDSSAQRWLDVPADITILAAGASAIDESAVSRVRADFIVEGGNMSCTPGARSALHKAGVCVLPDVVVNVGGAAVTGCVLTGVAPSDLPPAQLRQWLREWIGDTITRNCDAITRLTAAADPDPVSTLLALRRSGS
ncbi:Glu/Leu/Phe/Val dehydrogenase dimerization domain-containing protein [Amycolatopsis sp. cmx-11-12]|uniref:Glu/Leu/Phe/Val dehydrogenase dimerization domain-containing protein n=1 Tax=Amycolatopsis sp. cmx-11-12 TaxID=2785795 RepID=UPI00391719D5